MRAAANRERDDGAAAAGWEVTRPTIAALALTRDIDYGQMSALIEAFHAVAVASRASSGTLIAAALHFAAESALGEETGLVDLARYVAARQVDKRQTKEGRT